MKYLIPFFLIVISGFIGCSKDGNNMNDPYFSTDSVAVPINQCITKKYSGDTTIVYCLDSIADSRCPGNAVCVWQGYAAAKLGIKINQVQHQVKLFTPIYLVPYRSDTTIAGFNFKLVDVTPYPFLPQNPMPNYQAILKVKRL